MILHLAVFDIAGTTVRDDNFVDRALHTAFLQQHIGLRNIDTAPLMGYPKPVAIQMILDHQGIAAERGLIENIHQGFVNEMLSFYATSPEVQPMPGAQAVFRYLKDSGAKIALNTGFSRNIAQVIVERFQWQERGLIDAFIGSDEVAQGRPFPDMINKLKADLDLPADAVVMKVGDTIVDVQEGKAAGCRLNVAVTTGATPKSELQKQGPTHIVDSLDEIPAILPTFLKAYA